MNLCKKIGKSIAIAFSMYSKIPMVQFEWKEEDMRYSMCFFPLVGIVIGLLSWCWWLFCQQFGIGKMCFAFVGLAIILLVTGGIHMDGYMDTMDALHSYGNGCPAAHHRRHSHGWISGCDGCQKLLPEPGTKAGNLKGFSYWCICRDYDCSLCADSSRCIF